MTDPPHLWASGYRYAFPGGTEALRDLSFTASAGSFLSLVGPSGCGKSTLLRLVAGLLSGGTGELRVHGIEPTAARRRGRELAFVFQAPTLLPWRTVEGNIRLPLELQRRSGAGACERIDELLDLVGLTEFRRAYPHELSGGMQMRVSVARSLITDPDLLLLDEPFAALDEITRQRLNEELLALWQRRRFTALFVTHQVGEAVFLAERVLLMSARPGAIRREFPVPFAYPRLPALRSEPEFARLSGEIARHLREEFA